MKFRTLLASAAIVLLAAVPALARKTHLRIQTHYGPETISGKNAAQFVDDVQTMSNGDITIEMFYSSSVVASVETFDAAANGILDCDMTGGAYQTGKNPAFQFVGDIMGGYDTPFQQLGWLYTGGGLEAAEKLYNKYGMQLIGWWVVGQESLASTKPIKRRRRSEGLEIPLASGDGDQDLRKARRQADRDGLHRGLHRPAIGDHRRRRCLDPGQQQGHGALRHRQATPPIPASTRCRRTIWPATRPSGTAMPEIQQRIMRVAMQKLALAPGDDLGQGQCRSRARSQGRRRERCGTGRPRTAPRSARRRSRPGRSSPPPPRRRIWSKATTPI